MTRLIKIIHLSAESVEGYGPNSPVEITYQDGRTATTQLGSDVEGLIPDFLAAGGIVDEFLITLDDLKAAKRAAIEAEGQTRLAAGFAYAFGGTYGTKVLQLRPGTEDRLNWTNALLGYQAQIGAGNGAVDGAFIRTADNTTLQLSYIAAATALGAMLAWGAAHFQVVWAKKDLVNTAADETELNAISIDTGWPGE